jgi:hypothetical protein
MSPRRADYKTRKEYRWAKKVEQRGHIANAPSIPGGVIVSCVVGTIVGVVVGAGVGSGAVAVVVGLLVAIGFYLKWGAKTSEVWNTKEIAERQRAEREGREPPPRARDQWKPGQRVADASGRKGTVKAAVEGRPNYYDVAFDDGTVSTIKKVSAQELKAERQKQDEGVQPPNQRQATSSERPSTAEELERLARLRKEGALTVEQFEAAKAKVLG